MSNIRPLFHNLAVGSLITGMTVGSGVPLYLYVIKPYIVSAQRYSSTSYSRGSFNDYLDQSDPLRSILSHLNNTKGYNSNSQISIPNYFDKPELFKYLSTRSVSVKMVKKDTNSSYKLDDQSSATGFILGSASSNNQEHWYYLATTADTAAALIKPDLIQSFYSVSTHLTDNENVSSSLYGYRLLENTQDLVLSFSPQSKQDNDYYKMTVDSSWSFNANDQNTNSQSNHPGTNRQQNPKVDFAVVRVNLKPVANQFDYKFSYDDSNLVFDNSLTKTDYYHDTILNDTPVHNDHYLSLLSQSISTYGDISFSKDSSDIGYMMSYPSTVNKNDKDNDHKNKVLKQPKFQYTLPLNVQISSLSSTIKQPTDNTKPIEYSIPDLTLPKGSEGSALISYYPQKDNKNKFSYSGIYWGVELENSLSPERSSHLHKNKIQKGRGMISKVRDQTKYDLIGKSQNSSDKYSLCDLLSDNKPVKYKVNTSGVLTKFNDSNVLESLTSRSLSNTNQIQTLNWSTPDYCKDTNNL